MKQNTAVMETAAVGKPTSSEESGVSANLAVKVHVCVICAVYSAGYSHIKEI